MFLICIQKAALHLIGTFSALNRSWHSKLYEDVLVLGFWSDHQNPNTKVSMGKQHVLVYIPNHFTVSLHFFVIIYINYKDSKTPKITKFEALAGQIKHSTAQKVGFMPQLIRHRPRHLQQSNSAAAGRLPFGQNWDQI